MVRTLADRLARRFEDRICRVCVHRTADGGCTLTDRRQCPIFEWAEQLAPIVRDVRSDRLADYIDQIQAIVCPQCVQDVAGHCAEREHLDCPLDLYLGLVVECLEDELKSRPIPETNQEKRHDGPPPTT